MHGRLQDFFQEGQFFISTKIEEIETQNINVIAQIFRGESAPDAPHSDVHGCVFQYKSLFSN
jgi:hypothetical protein